MHSDRGSQYASDEHRQTAQRFRMIQSMSRRANCWDNAAMESFFKTLKVERTHLLRYDTRAAGKLDIVELDRRLLQSPAHAFVDRLQDTSRC